MKICWILIFYFGTFFQFGCFEPENFDAILEIKQNWDYKLYFTGQVRSVNAKLNKKAEAHLIKTFREKEGVRHFKKIGPNKYDIIYEGHGNVLKSAGDKIAGLLFVRLEDNKIHILYDMAQFGNKTKGTLRIRTERPIVQKKNVTGTATDVTWEPSPSRQSFEIVMEAQTPEEMRISSQKSADILAAGTKFREINDFTREYDQDWSENAVVAKRKYAGKTFYLKGAIESIQEADNGFSAFIITESDLGKGLGPMLDSRPRAYCRITGEQAITFKKGTLVEFAGRFNGRAEAFYGFEDCAVRIRSGHQKIEALVKDVSKKVEALTAALQSDETEYTVKNRMLNFSESMQNLSTAIRAKPEQCNYAPLLGGPMASLDSKLKKLNTALVVYAKKHSSLPSAPESAQILKAAEALSKVCSGDGEGDAASEGKETTTKEESVESSGQNPE